MLNPKQFGKPKPIKAAQPPQPPKAKSSAAGYKFLPPFKTQEERDLMEAKAKALNLQTKKNL
ncbi:unannotated protein [freshwater metagenome]|jgi:hypothetical protein|uniref:Unannotated protein n=1 Tax=freshwater metagenome TaxID=449393 RepID=A0A6J7A1G7_9ZZZZ